jgi:hypothetical protein
MFRLILHSAAPEPKPKRQKTTAKPPADDEEEDEDAEEDAEDDAESADEADGPSAAGKKNVGGKVPKEDDLAEVGSDEDEDDE